MAKLPRRQVLGTMAASVITGAAAVSRAATPSKKIEVDPALEKEKRNKPLPPLRKMTLKEFLAESGGEGVDDVISKMDCQSFTMCHKKMREETGLWIPELAPVFEKLDRMRGNPLV